MGTKTSYQLPSYQNKNDGWPTRLIGIGPQDFIGIGSSLGGRK